MLEIRISVLRRLRMRKTRLVAILVVVAMVFGAATAFASGAGEETNKVVAYSAH
jgi:predicted small secreted protein